MTTPSTPRKAGPLLGNGSQTTWPFTFKVFAEGDIAVTIANNLGVETALVLNTDYSVALNANQETSPGGTVTYPISGSPLPTGSVLTIVGDLDYDQPLDLPSGGNFSPLALENQLDRTVMQIQQLRELSTRTLQLPVTSDVTDVELPQPAASNIIGWNESGDNLANYPLADLATSLAFATYRYDTFTGDGVTTQFTLSADPVTLGNLDVAISGVTQVPGVDYTLTTGVLEFTSAPANGTTILARFGEGIASGPATDSYDVRFLPAGTGAVDRTVEAKLRETVSVKDFGAVGDGVADNKQAFTDALTQGLTALVPAGTFAITSGRVGELQIQPRQLYGFGTPSTILVDNPDETGFRIGAVGSGPSFGGSKVITKFGDLNFVCRDKSAGPAVATAAIDAQSVNPIVIENTRFFGFGPEALRLRRLYYGNVQGGYFVKSGLKMLNVNNFRLSDCDFFGGDSSLPSNTTLFGSEYPITFTDDDPFGGPQTIKFESTTFESWDIPLLLLQRSSNIIFDSVWFENLTGAHVLKLQQTRSVEFFNSFWDMAYTNSGTLFHVDNSGPSTTPSIIRQGTLIYMNGGQLRMNTATSTSVPVVTVANAETPRLLIDGLTFTRGHIFADPTVDIDVRSIALSTADQKSLYSVPNALMTLDRNSWMPDSQSSDWDFAAGANFAAYGGTAGLTIATTTTVGEYITGTRGVKVTGLASDGTAKKFARNCGTNGDMGPVTSEGQTYVFFLRVKCTQDVTFNLRVNGGFADFGGNPDHTLPAGEWRDYVLKTQEDSTWAQGRFLNPSIIVSVTNNSGSAAEFYIDRIDYQIVDGDFQI